jgi:hypothetical protein
MDVSRQLSAPAALIPRQMVRYLLGRRLSGAESRSVCFGVEKNLFPLPGIKLRYIYIKAYKRAESCLCYFTCGEFCTFVRVYIKCSGPGSSDVIATGYGLDGPGIESRWRRDFPHLSRPALWSTQPPVQWVPGVESGRGVTLTPHPLLVLRSKNTVEIPLLSLRAFLACKKGET